MTWARRQFIADVEGRANAPPAARPDSPQQGVGVCRETRSDAGEEEEWREEVSGAGAGAMKFAV